MDDKRAGWWAATFSTLLTLFVFTVGAFATTSPVLQTAVQRASTRRTRAFAFSLWYVSFTLAGALTGPFIIDATRRHFLDHATERRPT
jgi:hypothetical protein